jgi:hypothetical protein
MRCYNPPPLKKISSWDLENGGIRNDERCINQVARRIPGIRTAERRRSSRSSMPLFLVRCSGGKRTFSNSNIKDDITHWGKNFQTDSIIGAIGYDIPLDNRRLVTRSHGEIMTTWLESGPTPCRVLARNQRYTSSTMAMVDVCETTTIWLDDKYEPRGTLGWEWTICKHYLGMSSRDSNKWGKAFDHQS